MSDRKWPVSVMGTRWLTYCPHDGWDEHDAPEDAESAFRAIMDRLSDESEEQWYESADRAAWGVWIPIERLRLVATAWPDDDSADGERCREGGWDAFLAGVVRRVEPDAAALEFCAEFADVAAREEIARLRAEVERLRRILAVEQGDESAAPEGWRHDVDVNDNDDVREHVWTGASAYVCGLPHLGWRITDMDTGRTLAAVYSTALEAMEAADRAAKEVSDD